MSASTSRIKGVKPDDMWELTIILPKTKGVTWQEELRHLKEIMGERFDKFIVKRKVIKRDERAKY